MRRLRRSLQGRRSRVVLGVVGGLVVVSLGWALWRAYEVSQFLGDVERNAEVLRASMERGDLDGAREAMERFQSAADRAESRTTGPTWAVAERIPVLGADATGVRVVSQALAEIGSDGLPPLVDAADRVTARSFHPSDQVFPLDRIAEATADLDAVPLEQSGSRIDPVTPISRETNVHDREIARCARGHGQCRTQGRRNAADRMAELSKHSLQGQANEGLILDNEDSQRTGRS
jgi:hypothetical protein